MTLRSVRFIQQQTKRMLLPSALLIGIFFFSGFSKSASAQTEEYFTKAAEQVFYKYSPPSPQTWGFMKYGNTPAHLYTGTAHVEIPVYTYSDVDFTIPISLGYASGGFMPEQQTGILGLNWFLNAGGVITREIRGLEDFSGRSSQGRDGFLTTTNFPYSDKELLCSTSISSSSVEDTPDYKNRELESDLYHFNFMGHSGTFHYDGALKCNIYNTNGNHNAYNIQWAKNSNGTIYFVVKTPDGYEYTFGCPGMNNDDTYVECSVDAQIESDNKCWLTHNKNQITAWMLSQIKAPNGRIVSLKYGGGASGSDDPDKLPFNYNCDEYIVTFAKVMGYTPTGEIYSRKLYKKPMVTKTTYLSEIAIDNRVYIRFGYSNKQNKEVFDNNKYTQNFLSSYVQRLRVLSSIYVKDSLENKLLRTCKLSYDIKDKRTLLSKATIDENLNYLMEYYTNSYSADGATFPDILGNGVDFWGFANGEDMDETCAYDGTMVESGTYDEVIAANSKKRPNADKSIYGNLKKITYPTGGNTVFEYEGHTAEGAVLKRSKRTNHGLDPDFDIAPSIPILAPSPDVNDTPYLAHLHSFSILKTGDNKVGGVRVKYIQDDDGSGGRSFRRFEYIDKRMIQSGNMLIFPRYLLTTGVHDVSQKPILYLNPILTSFRHTFDKTHIEYSRILEHRADGTKIEYEFSNYRDTPDDYQDQHKTVRFNDNYFTPEQRNFCNIIRRSPNSRHYQRGKLQAKSYYNNTGDIVRKEEYIYADHNTSALINYSTTISISYHNIWTSKLYTADHRLVETKVTEFGAGPPSIMTTKYGYNSFGQLCSTRSYDGIATRTDSVVYVSVAANSTAEYKLKNNTHQLNSVKERLQLRSYDGVDYLVGGCRYQYKLAFGSIPCIEHIEQYAVRIPEALHDKRTTIEKETFDVYDKGGRLLQRTGHNSLITSYIWGYGGLYIVAIAQNVTIAQIEAAGLIGLKINPLSGGIQAHESTLRAIPNAQITTYQYQPFVGITRVIDITGRKTTYTYDAFRRLVGSYDEAGNPIKSYLYHITPLL